MSDRPTRSIEIEKTVDASPEEVWDALTTSEGLKSWFPLDARVDPGVEGSVWLSWGPGVEGEAPIHVFEAGSRFGWTEHYGDDEDGRPIKVAVDFYIEGRDGSTVVRLVQSGLSADADWDEMYDALVDGWTYFMFNLVFWFQHHRGRSRRMAWKRAATDLARDAAWHAIASTGLIADAPAEGSTRIDLDMPRPATVVSSRKGHHYAATLPDLDDSILFVELEGRHVGFWLSTYSLDDEAVAKLQTALDARVEQALGADA